MINSLQLFTSHQAYCFLLNKTYFLPYPVLTLTSGTDVPVVIRVFTVVEHGVLVLFLAPLTEIPLLPFKRFSLIFLKLGAHGAFSEPRLQNPKLRPCCASPDQSAPTIARSNCCSAAPIGCYS